MRWVWESQSTRPCTWATRHGSNRPHFRPVRNVAVSNQPVSALTWQEEMRKCAQWFCMRGARSSVIHILVLLESAKSQGWTAMCECASQVWIVCQETKQARETGRPYWRATFCSKIWPQKLESCGILNTQESTNIKKPSSLECEQCWIKNQDNVAGCKDWNLRTWVFSRQWSPQPFSEALGHLMTCLNPHAQLPVSKQQPQQPSNTGQWPQDREDIVGQTNPNPEKAKARSTWIPTEKLCLWEVTCTLSNSFRFVKLWQM